MAIELIHTIIWAADKAATARLLAETSGVEVGPEWSHFVPIRLANGVTLDFAEAASVRPQHFAFLVSEAEFDAALTRLKNAGTAFYADFNRASRGEINHLYGGRGVYFDDPNSHLFELITQPYRPVPERWIEAGA
jgi:catechol 2,3-dioxygenase-like lactoylglutathione lyase family enzyme